MGAMAPFLAESIDPGTALRLGYVDDAQVSFGDAPFVRAERDSVLKLGHEVVGITVRGLSATEFERTLGGIDALYVASGSTFALLEALRVSGCDVPLVKHVRAGLPYVGSSAGSIIAGPDVTPASLMDDPADGPALTDHDGLGLIDQTVIPHADGKLPPYPPDLIRRTLEAYGADYPLVPLSDDQALLVDETHTRVIDSGC